MILFLHVNYLSVYYSLYKLNSEELTRSCCEKKVAGCNAKCYVQKKMNDDSSSRGRHESPEIKLKISEFNHSEENYISPEIYTEIYFPHKINNLLKGYVSENDHPPEL